MVVEVLPDLMFDLNNLFVERGDYFANVLRQSS
jgi:hypothetical protein